jgi:hypothetical protein
MELLDDEGNPGVSWFSEVGTRGGFIEVEDRGSADERESGA